MMKQHITFSRFVDAFNDMGRGDQFSYHGLRALFEYLEDFEEDTGETIELDVIGLCVDFTEYSDVMEAASEYGEEFTDEESALDWFKYRTMVIEFDSGVIIGAF